MNKTRSLCLHLSAVSDGVFWPEEQIDISSPRSCIDITVPEMIVAERRWWVSTHSSHSSSSSSSLMCNNDCRCQVTLRLGQKYNFATDLLVSLLDISCARLKQSVCPRRCSRAWFMKVQEQFLAREVLCHHCRGNAGDYFNSPQQLCRPAHPALLQWSSCDYTQAEGNHESVRSTLEVDWV